MNVFLIALYGYYNNQSYGIEKPAMEIIEHQYTLINMKQGLIPI